MSVVIDGFSLLPAVVSLPERWPVLAVDAMAELRTSPSRWRPRWFTVPENGLAIDAYSQSLQTVDIRPGSVLYGFSFSVVTGAADDLTIAIAQTGARSLFSSPVSGRALAPTAGSLIMPMVLLAQPWLITAPVSVNIANQAATARTVQLLMFCGEVWQ